MKRKSLRCFIAAASLTLPALSNAATIVNGGTVNFTGEVINAACAVDLGSSSQTVNLGQVRTAKLNQQGAVSGAASFNITLQDCDTSVSTRASVAFQGVTTGTGNNVLALTGGASGVAQNVGVQIFYANDTNALALDGATFTTAMNLSDGKNVLPFTAKYFATGVATPGTANAEANFSVQYQ